MIIANTNTNNLSGTILGYQPNERGINLSTGRAFFNFNRSLMKEGTLKSRRQSDGA